MNDLWSIGDVSAHWERSHAHIPGLLAPADDAARRATATAAPVLASHGEGPWLYDVQGRCYCDLAMGWGALLLGYRNAAVEEAISTQLSRGTFFSLPTAQVGALAERIAAIVPGAEQVAFGKNGSEATLLAIRIARIATGRRRIAVARGHFHGFHDWFVPALRAAGVPDHDRDLLVELPLHDIPALEAKLKTEGADIAAFVFEPARDFEPPPGFLQRVVATAHRHGVLVVFDEIVTGLRLAPGGAAERYSATPDLACFGKSLANGLPLSFVSGPRDLLRHAPAAFVSMTYQYEQLAFAAAHAVLSQIAAGAAAPLWERGERLRAAVRDAAERHRVPAALLGPAPRMSLHIDFRNGRARDAMQFLIERLWHRQIHFGGNVLLSTAHGDAEIDQVSAAFAEAIGELAEAVAAGDVARRLRVPFSVV